MKKHKIIILILMSLLIVSCSQGTKKTTAKLKLNIGSLATSATGVGAGGGILFGKSSTGEQFGKLISGVDLDIELANGDWSFYAVMWEKTTVAANMYDTVYCAKSTKKLGGTAATISLNLTNNNCADSDFSNGNYYTAASKIKFSDFYIEECDDLSAAASWHCKGDNQGSALSYRMAFRSYTKSSSGALIFNNDVLYSRCMAADGTSTIFNQGAKLNFPSSTTAMPFVVTAEMFLGSPNCGVSPENKGVYTNIFKDGIGASTSAINKLAYSPAVVCSVAPSTKEACDDIYGEWSGICSYPRGLEPLYEAFRPTSECSGTTGITLSSKYIKQMVVIPKEYLCQNISTGMTGGDVFPGGDGSRRRPYKICNEWQINQIGESYVESLAFSTKSFKLMNDLDMNNADFNAPARPSCVGVANSIYKKHHNFNPIGQTTSGGCDEASYVPGSIYSGHFNGNNKTISHARIYINKSYMGFVRSLGFSGLIKNLKFMNLEVEGQNYVGGVVGAATNAPAEIDNVTIIGGHIEGGDSVGGVVGLLGSGSVLSSIQARDLDVHGDTKIGGLTAANDGIIKKSMFRGSIAQHMDMDTRVGGIAGISGGVITESFSEGRIESYSKWTGGITGTNGGDINNSYSNMFILSNSRSDDSFTGGISGGNEAGSISNVYFDGRILSFAAGGNSVSTDAISAYGSSPLNCFTPLMDVSISGCTIESLRTGATGLLSNALWKANINGAMPRLLWEHTLESRVCLRPNNLISLSQQTGRGSALSPLLICSPDQLKEIGSVSGLNAYIELAEDINVSGWEELDLVSYFSANLNGSNHSIYGLNINGYSDGSNLGFIKNNTGHISNINFYGSILDNVGTTATGAVAGVNSGVIKNVNLFGNIIQGIDNVGQVTGSNTGAGELSGITINQGSVYGRGYVGGVAGLNDYKINRVASNVNIYQKNGSTDFYKIGGITGYSGASAVIDQTSYSGNMNLSVLSSANPIYVGGLVGYNNGVLSNSMTKNYAQMNVLNSNNVGGLVGLNNTGASIQTSMALGGVHYLGSVITGTPALGAITGLNSGVVDKTFYLENNLGRYLGQSAASSCLVSSIDFSTAQPIFLQTAGLSDLFMPALSSSSDGKLQNMYSFSYDPSYIINYTTTATSPCSYGIYFSFYKSYEPSVVGKKSIDQFNMISTFTGYNMAYEASTSGASRLLPELIAYYKSLMYKTPVAATAPVWEFEEGRAPRLIQIND